MSAHWNRHDGVNRERPNELDRSWAGSERLVLELLVADAVFDNAVSEYEQSIGVRKATVVDLLRKDCCGATATSSGLALRWLLPTFAVTTLRSRPNNVGATRGARMAQSNTILMCKQTCLLSPESQTSPSTILWSSSYVPPDGKAGALNHPEANRPDAAVSAIHVFVVNDESHLYRNNIFKNLLLKHISLTFLVPLMQSFAPFICISSLHNQFRECVCGKASSQYRLAVVIE